MRRSTLQKTLKKPRPLHRFFRSLRHFPSLHPKLYTLLRASAVCAAGFALSGAALLGRPLPLCLAFLSAMPGGILNICAYFGTVGGILYFWGIERGLTALAAGFLIAAECFIFRSLLTQEKRWFLPVSSAAYWGLISFFPLLHSGFPPLDTVEAVLDMLLLCGASFLFLKRSTARIVLLLAGILSAARGILFLGDLSLGAFLASAICCLFLGSQNGIAFAAALGLMLDLAPEEPTAAAGVFLCAALFCALPIPKKRWMHILVFSASCTGFVFLIRGISVSDYVAMMLGGVFSVLLPEKLCTAVSASARDASEISESLTRAAQVFSRLGALLTPQLDTKTVTPAEIFDAVSDRVCQNCEKAEDCWEKNAKDTYLALSAAAARFLPKGHCEAADFPPFFLEKCEHQTEFLCACSELLLNFRKSRQYAAKLFEAKTVLSRQYAGLSRALCGFSAQKPPFSAPAFRADVGYRAMGIRCSHISGDFGCNFEYSGKFYLLLCDGMGTGLLASEQAEAAAGLLRQMIFAGFLPKDAIETLGGIYLLRENAAFSTVDLLEVDLSTADGTLYKSGAAPSFLKQGHRVLRLGHGSPPPGCVQTPTCEQISVSLGGGTMLILASDGLDACKTEEFLLSTRKTDLSELAAELVSAAGDRRDDCSAALVRFSELPHT